MTDHLHQLRHLIGRMGTRVSREESTEGVCWEFRGSTVRRLVLGMLIVIVAFPLLVAGTKTPGTSMEVMAWFLVAVGLWIAVAVPLARLRITRDGVELVRSFHPFGLPIAFLRIRSRWPSATLDTRQWKSATLLCLRSGRGERVIWRFPGWVTLSGGDQTPAAVEELVRRIRTDATRLGRYEE